MTSASRALALALALAAPLGSACAPVAVQTQAPPPAPAPEPAPARSGETLVVLLADDDSGSVGRVTVSNAAGSLDLDTAGASTTVTADRPPAPMTVLSNAEVKDAFGDALAALPPAPRYFTLLFRFESEELTDESRRLVPVVMSAIRDRPVPDVVVVGHTDTTGTRSSNAELGLKRARTVRALLIETGLVGSAIELASHGEGELLVKTPDGVFEPRNRRVEITVR